MIGPGGFMAAPKAVLMHERCEWNPVLHEAASGDAFPVEGDCQNAAVWSVGSNGKWHLCDSCAADPAFRRMTKRVPIGKRRAQPQPAEQK